MCSLLTYNAINLAFLFSFFVNPGAGEQIRVLNIKQWELEASLQDAHPILLFINYIYNKTIIIYYLFFN